MQCPGAWSCKPGSPDLRQVTEPQTGHRRGHPAAARLPTALPVTVWTPPPTPAMAATSSADSQTLAAFLLWVILTLCFKHTNQEGWR